jgi:hypothetical protein
MYPASDWSVLNSEPSWISAEQPSTPSPDASAFLTVVAEVTFGGSSGICCIPKAVRARAEFIAETREIKDHLRDDIEKVDEPQLKAMFEPYRNAPRRALAALAARGSRIASVVRASM